MREGPQRAVPPWVALLLAAYVARELSDLIALRRSANLAKGRKIARQVNISRPRAKAFAEAFG